MVDGLRGQGNVHGLPLCHTCCNSRAISANSLDGTAGKAKLFQICIREGLGVTNYGHLRRQDRFLKRKTNRWCVFLYKGANNIQMPI